MDQTIRNKLRGVVTQCRKLLEDSTAQALQGRFGIYAARKKGEVQIEDEARMVHLTEEDRACRQDLLDHLEHIQAIGYKPSEALEQLVREISFTHLNRLCAYKMMESRGLIREAVSRGLKSQGFFFYLSDHPEDEKLHNGGGQETAYRNFLDWLGGTLSQEIGVLFNPNDPANRIYPPQRVLDEVLVLINDGDLKDIWSQDETIGWVYQYFTPKELRDKARKESQAPRNSYELAFRNQFFTPRYVVEFLTDNTLGRIWYEMRKGKTILKDRCKYLVRRPTEMFLKEGETPPAESKDVRENLSQEELLKQPVYIPHRPKKDPRELKVLDPACGSAHFLLYCFDLLQVIYEEAYDDPDLGAALRRDYPAIEDLRRAVPALILKHNLHGIDIDLRATQIAALALWLRCQRAYQELGLKNGERPKITRSNIVCAEPMPGETDLLRDFTSTLQPKVLGQLVEAVFEKMKLAGEAGSLLKIEEEIREVAGNAKFEFTQWKKHQDKAKWSLFPELAKRDQPSIFDFADISDEDFLDRVEDEIIAALRQYAEKASNGRVFRKKLFAEDAARGFSFVDVCRRRFDVVLMNPPFGSYPASIQGNATSLGFPLAAKDIGTAFVQRGCELVSGSCGFVGSLTNRNYLNLPSYEEWRKAYLLEKGQLRSVADLGYGVLDDAVVEAAAYTLADPLITTITPAIFISCLDSTEKGVSLAERTSWFSKIGVFSGWPQEFLSMPSCVIAYTAPPSLRSRIKQWLPLKDQGLDARIGMSSRDDERFLRTAWEVQPHVVGVRWRHLAKGGEWSPFYDDIHLMLDWADNGRSLADSDATIRNPSYYFRPGLTYPERTTSGFGPRVMPRGCAFTTAGQAIFFENRQAAVLYLGLLLSRSAQLLIEIALGGGDSSLAGTAARHYTNGMINRLPFPHISDGDRKQIVEVTEKLIHVKRKQFDRDETSRFYIGPAFSAYDSLSESAIAIENSRLDNLREIAILSSELETLSEQVFGLRTDEEKHLLWQTMGPSPHDYLKLDDGPSASDYIHIRESELIDLLKRKSGGGARFITKNTQLVDRRLELISHLCQIPIEIVIDEVLGCKAGAKDNDVLALITDIIAYGAGVALGRWDIRFATGDRQPSELPDPFDPLPVCPPGMLQGPDGLPAKPEDVPSDYPIRIDWDGILVDDLGHENDIVRRVRDVLEVIWKDRAEAIEREACEILGVRELRDYFRKPGNGGFWMDHVKRYSKSRRKAPIYWYLRSTKGNYGLWLYYHRLDKDILFKALLNYVEPKIRLEEDRLRTLRGRKESAGSSGREAKQIEKDMDRQEQLVSELHDFADKLRRAANLHLVPDLNDGVVLTIAPLVELVPWKEAKEYWEDLVAGKYEWSSIGKQMREKGLVKK